MYQRISVRNLGGGRNTFDSELRLDPAQSANDLNVLPTRRGAIEKRPGHRLFTGYNFTNAPVLSLYRFYRTDLTKQLIIGAGDQLWAGDENTPPIMTRIGSGFVPCQPWSFAAMHDWLYMGNFADVIYRWDGSELKQGGLDVPSVGSLASVIASSGTVADRDIDAGVYTYRVSALYGKLGESNMSTEFWTVTAPTSPSQVDFADFGQYLPDGATGYVIYRTLANDPLAEKGVFFRIGEFVDTYVDITNDRDLAVEYRGDIQRPPNAAYLTVYSNRMVYAYCMERDGSEVYPSRVMFSEFLLPDRVNPLEYIDISPEDGDFITGVVPFRGNLVVFKRNRIYQILGSSFADFDVRDTHSDVGALAPLSIAELNNKIYFLSGNGVYYFDGSRTERVSDSIRPDLDRLSPTARFWASGVAHDNRYGLSVYHGD